MHLRTIIPVLVGLMACQPMPTTQVKVRYPPGVGSVRLEVPASVDTPTLLSDEFSDIAIAHRADSLPGFTGPYLLDNSDQQWRMPSGSVIADFRVAVNGEDRTNDLQVKHHVEPGLWVQSLGLKEIHFELKAYFHDENTLLVHMSAQHLRKGKLPVDFTWNKASVDGFELWAPNDSLTIHPARTEQRINFLSYEQRSLQWIFQRSDSSAVSGERPELSQAYEANCARWLKRNRYMYLSEYPEWIGAATQVLVSNARSSIRYIDSLALSFIDVDLAEQMDVDAPSADGLLAVKLLNNVEPTDATVDLSVNRPEHPDFFSVWYHDDSPNSRLHRLRIGLGMYDPGYFFHIHPEHAARTFLMLRHLEQSQAMDTP